MTFSCSDYADQILEKLVQVGLITPTSYDDQIPENQATVSLTAIDNLLEKVSQLTSLVHQASGPGGIGEHEFTRPGGWRERALLAIKPIEPVPDYVDPDEDEDERQ